MPPWPALPLFSAIVGTQILAVLMCGFGWFVTPIHWKLIGLVWLYMLAWMVLLDLVKQVIYRKISNHENGRPPWYKRFLHSRSAGRK